jgi:ribose transport system substrate-binding protein
MNVVVSGVPFWTEAKTTWEQLPNLYANTKTSFGGPSDVDVQRQAEELATLISAGNLDGLFIYPGDSSTLKETIKSATKKGIPVVTFLTDCPDSDRLTYITSDLDEAGFRLGKHVLKSKRKDGKAIICYGAAGNDEQEARADGLKAAIEKTNGLQLLTVIEDKFDDAVGAEAVKTLLTQHDDIVAIMGCNSRSAVGAIQALKELGYKPGDVLVAGWDFDNQSLDLIEEGWINASAAQQSEFMTYLAFNIFMSFHAGHFDKLGKTDDTEIPSQIIVPVEIITKSNASKYRRK